MFCDGSVVWVIDPALKEVVIEPVAEQEKVDLFTNPARIVMNISDSFNVNVSNDSSDGKAQVFSLSPKQDTDMEYLNVEIWKDSATVRSMSFAMKDGTLVTIKVSSMKLTPKVSDETFKPRFVFDSKWLVTDLR
jgi:outer membrane lipoprotein-sorting protein